MKTITPLKEEERNLNIKIYEIDTEYIVSPPRRGVTVMRLVGLTDYKELTKKHEADTLRTSAEIKKLKEALKKIENPEGAYSRDKLTFCENTIENMKEIARKALK